LEYQNGGDQASAPSSRSNEGWITRRVRQTKRHLQQRRAEKAHETAIDRATRGTNRASWVIAIATIVTAGAAISQYFVFDRQLASMNGQLDEMKAARLSDDQSSAQQLDVLQSQAGAMQQQATAMRGQLDALKAANAETERAITVTNELAIESARSANQMERLANASLIANALTKQLAEAATKANEINNRSVSGVQRAFVVVNGVKVDFRGDKNLYLTWMISPQFENEGNTPAVNLMVRVRCEESATVVNDPYDIPSPVTRYGIAYKMELAQRQTGAIIDCPVRPFGKIFLTQKTPTTFTYGYVFGSAAYRDVFDKTAVHLTEFCFQAFRIDFPQGIPGPHTLPAGDESAIEKTILPCATHNCIDEECDAAARERAAQDVKAIHPQ